MAGMEPTIASLRSKHFIHFTLSKRRALVGLLFFMPFILGVLIWEVLPGGVAVWLTFQEWNLISPPKFVGMKNIIHLFHDPLLLQSLKVTGVFTLFAVPLQLVIGLILAMLLNIKVKGLSFFRTAYYLPTIVPAVANAILWAWILNTEFGLLNVGVHALGLPKIAWLQDPHWALPALILMSLWALGNPMIIFLAGLQGIPEVLYEAAMIDGAGRWTKFRNITLPILSPVIFFNVITGFINTFQTFSAGYLITQGGPQNSTLFLALYQYRVGFQNLKMGYAAAIAWVMLLTTFVLAMVIFFYLGRRVYYEDIT
jgi:multiple sugar transport system permease protein